MKTILVPTDFSEFSKYALKFAIQLAEKANLEIRLLHVIEAPVTHTFSTLGLSGPDKNYDDYYLELVRTVKKKMEAMASIDHPKAPVIPEVFIGKPYENIAEHVSKHAADLIIMGTKGCTGLEELLVGSNTEKVVRYAGCPVISVPCSVDINELNNIVFATNLMDNEGAVIQSLKELQKVVDATISLLWVNTLHVIQNEEEIVMKLEKLASMYGLENYSVNIVKSVSPEMGIMDFAEKHAADLIAMATHSRHGLAHIFSGSLAEDIVNHSRKPVWSYSLKHLS